MAGAGGAAGLEGGGWLSLERFRGGGEPVEMQVDVSAVTGGLLVGCILGGWKEELTPPY